MSIATDDVAVEQERNRRLAAQARQTTAQQRKNPGGYTDRERDLILIFARSNKEFSVTCLTERFSQETGYGIAPNIVRRILTDAGISDRPLRPAAPPPSKPPLSALQRFVRNGSSAPSPAPTQPTAQNETKALIQRLGRKHPDASVLKLADLVAQSTGATISTSQVLRALAETETVKRPLSGPDTDRSVVKPAAAKPLPPAANEPRPAAPSPETVRTCPDCGNLFGRAKPHKLDCPRRGGGKPSPAPAPKRLEDSVPAPELFDTGGEDAAIQKATREREIAAHSEKPADGPAALKLDEIGPLLQPHPAARCSLPREEVIGLPLVDVEFDEYDRELDAMRSVKNALKGLRPSSMMRVLRWVREVLQIAE